MCAFIYSTDKQISRGKLRRFSTRTLEGLFSGLGERCHIRQSREGRFFFIRGQKEPKKYKMRKKSLVMIDDCDMPRRKKEEWHYYSSH